MCLCMYVLYMHVVCCRIVCDVYISCRIVCDVYISCRIVCDVYISCRIVCDVYICCRIVCDVYICCRIVCVVHSCCCIDCIWVISQQGDLHIVGWKLRPNGHQLRNLRPLQSHSCRQGNHIYPVFLNLGSRSSRHRIYSSTTAYHELLKFLRGAI